MNKPLTGLLAILWLTVAGCTEQSNQQQLQQTLETLSNRPSGRIEPLPESVAPPHVSYTGGDQRSPFRLHAPTSAGEARQASDLFRPKTDRERGPLEQIPLESLTLVGTLRFADAPAPTALLDDGQGEIHKVNTGDYIGQDFGRVVRITADTVFIEETIQDEQGGWVKRPRQLKLAVTTDE